MCIYIYVYVYVGGSVEEIEVPVGDGTAGLVCRSGIYVYIYYVYRNMYGVALGSRIDKIIGLFCKRALQKRLYSAKETCNFIDPTNRSHPIVGSVEEMEVLMVPVRDHLVYCL